MRITLDASADRNVDFSLEGHPMTKFTTGGEDGDDASKHIGDAYFLESNDKIRFFFEEGVYLPSRILRVLSLNPVQSGGKPTNESPNLKFKH